VEPPQFRIGPFEAAHGNGSGNGSTNGQRSGSQKIRRVAAGVWRVTSGALAGALVAGALVPRIHFLNLAIYNPWVRPVIAAGAGGLVAGLTRRSKLASAAGWSALAGAAGLWLAYLATRAQLRTLWVDRSAARVILADLARLGAYGVVPGAIGGVLGARLRTRRARESENAPITQL
jgi:hypothetical protein